jgi:hypothetical protein
MAGVDVKRRWQNASLDASGESCQHPAVLSGLPETEHAPAYVPTSNRRPLSPKLAEVV